MEQHRSAIFETDEPQLFLASQGKRLLNHIIDNTAYYSFYKLYNFFIASLYIRTYYQALHYNTILIIAVDMIISLCLFAAFMGGVETLFKGKSLGKLITGTRAVNEDGSAIGPRKAFLRALCRIVPLEILSALNKPCYPWHDRWTHTYVIDEKKSIYY